VTDDVRASILTASLDLMNEGGLGALSMREVARRAGVSHQAPYHYFADRESILAELVRDGFVRLHSYMIAALAKSPAAIDRVQAMGETYVRFALDYPAQFRLMFRGEMVDMERHEDAHSAAEQAFNLLVSEVAAVDSGEPPGSIAPIIACWAISHGLATLLLEGKAGHHFGETREDWDAGIGRVFGFFAKKFSA